MKTFPLLIKFKGVLKIGDKLFYIFSSFNKKEKKEDLFSREINMNDGTFASPKLLFSTAAEATISRYDEPAGATIRPEFEANKALNNNTLKFITKEKLGAPIRFEVHKSFDNSKMLIRYRLKPEW